MYWLRETVHQLLDAVPTLLSVVVMASLPMEIRDHSIVALRLSPSLVILRLLAFHWISLFADHVAVQHVVAHLACKLPMMDHSLEELASTILVQDSTTMILQLALQMRIS